MDPWDQTFYAFLGMLVSSSYCLSALQSLKQEDIFRSLLFGKTWVKSGKEGSPSTVGPPSHGKSVVRSLHLHSKYNKLCRLPPQ